MKRVALKSLKDGSFVSARFDEHGAPLRCNRPDAELWEQFELIELDPPPPPPASNLWKGASDFRLAQRQMAGEDIGPIIQQRLAVGANRLRVFAMKANNTGWDLIPSFRHDYFGDVKRFFDTTAPLIGIEWTVFADTALLPPTDQQAFWQQTCELAMQYPHVCLELLNEAGHPTQRIDPSQFARPSGIQCSHGSGLTDAHPVEPYWSYVTYHARRDGAKAFTNMNPYEFETNYPKPCPFIADESAKPDDYGFDPAFAMLMGRHAALGWGATFHTSQGVNSDLYPDNVQACAEAFFQGVEP